MLGNGFVNKSGLSRESGVRSQEAQRLKLVRVVISVYTLNLPARLPTPDLPQHHASCPQLMVEQPALLAEPSAVADQTAVLAHHPVAGNQYCEVIRGHQPPDLTRVEPGCPSHVIVGTGLAERDLS